MKHSIWISVLAALALGLGGCSGGAGGAGSANSEVTVAVTDAGFVPAEVTVPKGKPVTLVMTRKTDQTCATEVVFASLNQRYALPLNQAVRIPLPTNEARTLDYACGMNMISGKIIVQ
jgi:plastocyanin domain-containing protein